MLPNIKLQEYIRTETANSTTECPIISYNNNNFIQNKGSKFHNIKYLQMTNTAYIGTPLPDINNKNINNTIITTNQHDNDKNKNYINAIDDHNQDIDGKSKNYEN